ncbi:MAG TPA: hypothetical protein VD963_05955 [Phycisphaerales bacterium]|nr:hypothetical protein [Phycisphaerales bacterium]
MHLTPSAIALGVLGLGLLVLGLRILRAGPAWRIAEAEAARRPLPDAAFVRALSEPTRLSLAVVLLVTGYHLIVWGQPATLTDVQLSRRHWPWLLLLAGLWAGGSLMLDRLKRSGNGRGDVPGASGPRRPSDGPG